MKRTTYIVTIALCFAALCAMAQKEKAKPAPAPAGKKAEQLQIYLGNSGLDGGLIGKRAFDSLLKQGIKAQNPAAKIEGFAFSYNERTFFEDSVGHIASGMELMFEYCYGDTLSTAVKNSIFRRTKKGDTAYFDKIKVLMPDGNEGEGKPMKFVLTQ
ncbi:hypothetical protein ACTHGU_05085 [Chitinophagaceae bacterium MMS25-I14]